MFTTENLADRLSGNKLKDLLRQKNFAELSDESRLIAVENAVAEVTEIFINCMQLFKHKSDANDTKASDLEDTIHESGRLLRNSCAIGSKIQTDILNFQVDSCNVLQSIELILSKSLATEPKCRKICWQLLANLGVQNEDTQKRIWEDCIRNLITHFECVCDSDHYEEFTMILYNLALTSFISSDDLTQIAKFLLNCVSNESDHELQRNEFHQIFMEHLLTSVTCIAVIYEQLSPEHRLRLLYYINDHLDQENHQSISLDLIKMLVRELKNCSTKILNIKEIAANPRESFEVIDVIGQLSAHQQYRPILAEDCDVFMCVGCLLKAMTEIHKKAEESGQTSVFSPVQRLEDLSSTARNVDAPQDILYQLKTKLMRILTNLTYRNKRNQDLAREMGFLQTVLESTVLDAKNPFLKEWSIVCIRNLCERNEENQRIIGDLNKIGDVQNRQGDFDLETGIIRVNKN